MDNQHYRDLTPEEISVMNTIKVMGADIGNVVEVLRAMPSTDKRWVSIGATDLQTGLMALVRAVAQPTTF